MQGCGLRDEHDNFEIQGVQILGLSADPATKQKRFSDKQSFNYPLLSDVDKEVLEAYDGWGPKKFMGREFMGIHRIAYLIDEEGKIAHVWPKAKTMGFARDVLAVLDA